MENMKFHRKPIIAIIGTTGVGKSKFAIELARKFNGEIINADALQVYKGLDIATNKVTAEEMQTIPHHLMSFVDCKNEYTVVDFVRDASEKIAAIQSRERLPIVVGGTHYYVQSLLWKDSILPSSSNTQYDGEEKIRQEVRNLIQSTDQHDPTVLHEMLQRVDPVMALKWNPKDTRKILRSLVVYESTGRRHSDWLREQMQEKHPDSLTGVFPPRFPAIVFWLHSEWPDLDIRLDSRVDEMVERGLLNELSELRDQLAESPLDYTRGLLQAIGLKEFSPYFDENNDSMTLTSCMERMKIVTRQYARKQVSWIRKKLAPQSHLIQLQKSTSNQFNIKHDDISLVALNATAVDLNSWTANVLDPGIAVVASLTTSSKSETPFDRSTHPFLFTLPTHTLSCLAEAQKKQQTMLDSFKKDESALIPTMEKRHCDVCNKTTYGELEWSTHLKSRKHQKTVALRKSPQWPYYVKAMEEKRRKLAAQATTSETTP